MGNNHETSILLFSPSVPFILWLSPPEGLEERTGKGKEEGAETLSFSLFPSPFFFFSPPLPPGFGGNRAELGIEEEGVDYLEGSEEMVSSLFPPLLLYPCCPTVDTCYTTNR